MQPFSLLFFLIISTSAFSQNSVYGDYSSYKKIDTVTKLIKEQFAVDLDGDEKLDSIFIINLKDLEGDPEDFSEITVKFGNGNVLTLKNVNGYFRDTSISISVPLLYKSTRITVLDGPVNCTSIILNGYQYPSCHNHFTIVSIMKNGSFAVNNFSLAATEIKFDSNSGSIEVSGIDHCSNEQKTFIHKPTTE